MLSHAPMGRATRLNSGAMRISTYSYLAPRLGGPLPGSTSAARATSSPANLRCCHWLRTGVPRLIHTELSPSRQGELRKQAPSLIAHRPAFNPPLLHRTHKRVNVFAHEVELMQFSLLRRMHGNLGWRQSENQPAIPDIHVWELQDISKERTIRCRVGAVDDCMCAIDHAQPSVSCPKQRR